MTPTRSLLTSPAPPLSLHSPEFHPFNHSPVPPSFNEFLARKPSQKTHLRNTESVFNKKDTEKILLEEGQTDHNLTSLAFQRRTFTGNRYKSFPDLSDPVTFTSDQSPLPPESTPNIDLWKLFYPDRVWKHRTPATVDQHVPMPNDPARVLSPSTKSELRGLFPRSDFHSQSNVQERNVPLNLAECTSSPEKPDQTTVDSFSREYHDTVDHTQRRTRSVVSTGRTTSTEEAEQMIFPYEYDGFPTLPHFTSLPQRMEKLHKQVENIIVAATSDQVTGSLQPVVDVKQTSDLYGSLAQGTVQPTSATSTSVANFTSNQVQEQRPQKQLKYNNVVEDELLRGKLVLVDEETRSIESRNWEEEVVTRTDARFTRGKCYFITLSASHAMMFFRVLL